MGIVDLEFEFPAGSISVREMRDSSGHSEVDIREWTVCEEIPVFGAGDVAWRLVASVAGRVLERAGVAPEDIGQIIVAGSGDWDHPAWSPAAKVAAELGAYRAHCFEVINFCNAAAVAMQIAADTIVAGRTGFSLVLMGEQGSRGVDYTDPDSLELFNTGDCAAAVLLGAGDVAFEHVWSRSRTDPRLADYFVGEFEEGRVVTRRRARQLKLPLTYLHNYETLVAEALSALGMSIEDIRYVLPNQVDRRIHERLLAKLGLPEDRSVFNYERYGHMGCADPFIALAELRTGGRLRPGEVVLLATSGAGFSWGVTALRYRR